MRHQLLKKLNACFPAIWWAQKYTTLRKAWLACSNPFWLLWWLRKTHQISEAQWLKLWGDALDAHQNRHSRAYCNHLRRLFKFRLP